MKSPPGITDLFLRYLGQLGEECLCDALPSELWLYEQVLKLGSIIIPSQLLTVSFKYVALTYKPGLPVHVEKLKK